MHHKSAVAIIALTAASLSLAMGSKPKSDEEAVINRIAPVAKLQLANTKGTGPSGARSGEEIFKTACAACHETGAADAPKIGDKAAWAPRIAQGFDALMKSTINGKNAMPPKGGSDATENELARTVTYMANKSGANFKEPKPAKQK